MTEFKPNEERAKQARNILIVNIVITGVYFLQSLYHFFPLVVKGTLDIWLLIEALESVPTIPLLDKLNFIASVSGIVYFIRWFRRAYWNLHIRINDLKYEESAASWTWFVPIYNFFAPYQIMMDLVSKSQIFLIEKGIKPKAQLPANMVSWWWMSYIAGIFILFFGLIFIYSGAVESAFVLLLTIFGSNILTIISGFILIKIISQYTVIENQLADMHSEIDEIGEPG